MNYLDIDHVAFEDKKMLIYAEMCEECFILFKQYTKYLNDVKMILIFFEYSLVSLQM